MLRNWQWPPIVLIVGGSVCVLLGCLATVDTSLSLVVVGVLATLTSTIFLAGARTSEPQRPATSEEQQHHLDFDEWQQIRTAELEDESARLREKASELSKQAANFQEFLEYPVVDSSQYPLNADAEIRLSEQDHDVHCVLEAEAERVYEAIRNNDYYLNGELDGDRIRKDAFDLILRIARIYSPDSDNPLLETSFEQVARAASRVCLHTLVLLEQLPLDVKQYNINEMYGYIRKAVESYGTYKQVTPWIKHISRGAYVGRFAAGANPITLGAWWLATEVTRRGAKKIVERAVDRRAVAVLHDVVAVLGVEVANIYGQGFRQRDPAWICGTELTEMLHRFPMSRESLSHGLQEITKLPLRSEYDRIYLYRCVAQKRAAGSRLVDPTVLTRSEREAIASQLETFFTESLHGITDEDKFLWQADVESRLDLKLSLSSEPASRHHHEAAVDAVCSLHSFLVSIAAVPPDAAAKLVESTDLLLQVQLQDRAALLAELKAVGSDNRFEPPDLDPASSQAHSYLKALFECSVKSGNCDAEIEQLLLETGGYFRRSQDESLVLLDDAFRQELDHKTVANSPTAKLSPVAVRTLLKQLLSGEQLVAVYDDVRLRNGDKLTSVDQLRFAVFHGVEYVRAILISNDGAGAIVWRSDPEVTTLRRKGYITDNCEVTGGRWYTSASDCLQISGSITGGGYHRMFIGIDGSQNEIWR